MTNSILEQVAPLDAIDWQKLREGVEKANIPTLILCLLQMTGEQKWGADPFAPQRGLGIDANDSGGLDAATQVHVRNAAFNAGSDDLAILLGHVFPHGDGQHSRELGVVGAGPGDRGAL